MSSESDDGVVHDSDAPRGDESQSQSQSQFPPVSEDEIEAKYFTDGLTIRELADEYDVCRKTVSRWMDAYGIEADRSTSNDTPNVSDAELRELYVDEEYTLTDIADELGIATGTAYEWVADAGVEMRTQADYGKRPPADTLRELYHEDGLTQSEIAERFDASPGTVSEWCSYYGIETSYNHDSTIPPRAELYALYVEDELTQAEVADEYGVTQPAVNYWLDKHGIDESRDRSHGPKTEKPPRDELYDLYWEQYLTQAEIGERFGVSGSVVSRWMYRDGIDTR